MKDRLFETLLSLRQYLKEQSFVLSYGSNYREECIKVLQNVASTCILELEEQRKLGIKIPEPPPALARFLSAGMQSATHEEESDGKVNNETFEQTSRPSS